MENDRRGHTWNVPSCPLGDSEKLVRGDVNLSVFILATCLNLHEVNMLGDTYDVQCTQSRIFRPSSKIDRM